MNLNAMRRPCSSERPQAKDAEADAKPKTPPVPMVTKEICDPL
jgi:hypothetical protein